MARARLKFQNSILRQISSDVGGGGGGGGGALADSFSHSIIHIRGTLASVFHASVRDRLSSGSAECDQRILCFHRLPEHGVFLPAYAEQMGLERRTLNIEFSQVSCDSLCVLSLPRGNAEFLRFPDTFEDVSFSSNNQTQTVIVSNVTKIVSFCVAIGVPREGK